MQNLVRKLFLPVDEALAKGVYKILLTPRFRTISFQFYLNDTQGPSSDCICVVHMS